MTDDRIREEIISEFFRNTCQSHRSNTENYMHAFQRCIQLAREKFRPSDDVEYEYIPLITGSVAELYVELILSCVGDVDVMCHRIAISWQYQRATIHLHSYQASLAVVLKFTKLSTASFLATCICGWLTY